MKTKLLFLALLFAQFLPAQITFDGLKMTGSAHVLSSATLTIDSGGTLTIAGGGTLTGVQSSNANLSAIAGLTTAANKLEYWTGSGTAALLSFTSFSQTLMPLSTSTAWLDAIGPSSPATGDLLYYDGSHWNRLARGANNTLLFSTSSSIAWGGGVPSSSTDQDIAIFSGTGGKTFADSGTTLAAISPVGKHMMQVIPQNMVAATTNGCTALAQVELTAGQPESVSRDFDPSTQKYALFQLQMPKSWDGGTITAKFIWSHASTTTNFTVDWAIQAVAVPASSVFNTAYGTAQTVYSTGGTTNALYVSTETSSITVGGTPAAGAYVFFRVYRVAADSGDNLAVNARLHCVDIFFTTTAGNDN